MTHVRPSVLSGLLAFLALVGPAVVTEAATRFVANNGRDFVNGGSNTCVAHPCRSIGHAIQQATSGDTIVVGPGRYSWESEPGPGFCSCVIQVDKPVTIESSDGAGVTVLDATGHNVNVVQIEASDVIFGQLQKGFTLTGAVTGSAVGGAGLVIPGSGTSGVRVRGNLATRNGLAGFDVEGSGHRLRGNTARANGGDGFIVDGGSGHVLTGNVATANAGDGFLFLSTGADVLTGNTASANAGEGFFFPNTGSGHHLTGNTANANFDGFDVDGGSGHVLTGNVATANAFEGFFIGGTGGHVLTGNIASANGSVGFDFANGTSGNVFTGNAVLGNKGAGILIGPIGGSATVTQNNIFGNDGPPSTNCGLRNESGGAITATDNFWGTAKGPGTLMPQPEPADNVCDDTTNHPGSSTSVAPFATQKFPVETPHVEPGL